MVIYLEIKDEVNWGGNFTGLDPMLYKNKEEMEYEYSFPSATDYRCNPLLRACCRERMYLKMRANIHSAFLKLLGFYPRHMVGEKDGYSLLSVRSPGAGGLTAELHQI